MKPLHLEIDKQTTHVVPTYDNGCLRWLHYSIQLVKKRDWRLMPFKIIEFNLNINDLYTVHFYLSLPWWPIVLFRGPWQVHDLYHHFTMHLHLIICGLYVCAIEELSRLDEGQNEFV